MIAGKEIFETVWFYLQLETIKVDISINSLLYLPLSGRLRTSSKTQVRIREATAYRIMLLICMREILMQ